VTGQGTVLLASAGAVVTLMFVAWLVSLVRRDASVADVAWGLGFVLVAWLSFALADGADARKALVVVLTTVWGLRLTAYMVWRGAGEGEDFRYREMRTRYGKRFPLISLFVVFGFQGIGLWAVSLPVQIAQVPATPSGLTALDLLGAAVWTLGMVFEVGGDLQLARFKADPRNRGKLMTRGLWRYTRHPNYFGDFCVWWGLYLIALATGAGWWTVVGPLTMTFILLRISGRKLMDEHMARKPGYRDYARRTSGFLPRPPRTP
jgi:steroid 5-alpha reductase family enzyme